MTTEREKKDAVRKGEAAKRLLNDPVLQEALQDMREGIHYNLETCNWANKKEFKELGRMLRTIRSFEDKLTAKINAGEKGVYRLNQPKPL